MGRKIAVVLFNLGGPDSDKTVRPFLKNLFRDPAIIGAPLPVRWFLARLISSTRAPSVKKNYAMMDAGGGSPLLPETEKQAAALTAALAAKLPDDEVRCFIGMRYWHPFTEEAAVDVRAWGADEVILLPLYPQFSTTTTGSSLTAWNRAYKGPAKTICCYPFAEGLITAHVDRIMEAHRAAGEPGNVRLLLSAHGLPEKIVKDGDPYQWQCETMGDMLDAMGISSDSIREGFASMALTLLAMMAMVFVMWRVPKVGGGGALEAALPHAPASCLQLLRDLLAWNPLRRPSAKRALQYPFFLEVAAPAPPKVSILTLHPTHARPCSCHLTAGCLGA